MKRNKIPRILLAMLISVFLWLYVVTVVDPNDTKVVYSVPVTYENMTSLTDNNLVMTSGQNATVTLKFYGRRSDLNNLTSESLTVTADVSRIKSEGEQNLSYTVTLPDSVSNNNVQLTERTPSRLTVDVERAVEKQVDVAVDISNEVADGYVADLEAMKISPETITVFGPEAEVSKIDSARVSLDIGGVTETVDNSFPYQLVDADGNAVNTTNFRCSADAVDVTLLVEKYKEIPLTLELKAGGGAKEKDVTVTLSPAYITISGPSAIVDAMDSVSIGTLDLASMTEMTETKTYEITLPDNVTSVSGQNQVTARIVLNGLSTKTLEVENFSVSHKPDGLDATIVTTTLEITIRGPSDEIEAITAKDLTVQGDLSDFGQAGTYKIPVTVTSKDFPGVGMIGSASITVTLQ